MICVRLTTAPTYALESRARQKARRQERRRDIAAAARGDLVDEILMRFNDLVFAFPALLSAIMITAIFGPGAINAIIAIGIFNVPVFARVARAGALSIWPREFILAARAAGKSKTLITIEHILPNIVALLLVQGTIQFALGLWGREALEQLRRR